MNIDQCSWRQSENSDVSFLIDAREYYADLWKLLPEAQNHIYIAGWDIHSQIDLVPEANSSTRDNFPSTLSSFLDALLKQNPKLEVFILIWDFASFYSLERELFSGIRFQWGQNPRLKFHFDSKCPMGGSHHQKFVVVDDRLAYLGGIDLTAHRWDSPDHKAENPLRRSPQGEHYPPHHDVQAKIVGGLASDLGELFRYRWALALGNKLEAPRLEPGKQGSSAKGEERRTPSYLSRTLPRWKDRPAAREILETYLTLIAQAKKTIYLENQYFTSEKIFHAIKRRLRENSPPEIILVLPAFPGGWLEKTVMGNTQGRLIEELKNVDHKKHFAVFYPHIPGLSDGAYKEVHSKVAIIDQEWVYVGSANLTNRSMGLDAECNLLVQSQERAIELLQNLLADHCPNAPLLFRGESLKDWIEAQNSKEKACLLPFTPSEGRLPSSQELGILTDELGQLGDMERPVEVERFVDLRLRPVLKDERVQGPAWPTKNFILTGILSVFLGIVLIWPEMSGTFVQELRAWIRLYSEHDYAAIYTVALTTLALFCFLPLNPLAIILATIFSPGEAIAMTITSACSSALLTYFIGALLGPSVIENFGGKRVKKIRHVVKNLKTFPTILIRMLPIAPFGIVNITFGAIRFPVGKFIISTTCGLLPGLIFLVYFQTSLLNLLQEATLKNFFILTSLTIVAFLSYLFFRKRILS